MKKPAATLTGAEEQNADILRSLLNKCRREIQQKGPAGYEISKEVRDSVVSLYLNNEISQPSPNERDFKYVIQNNEQIKMSIRHLMFPIKEIYGIFKADNPEVKISLTSFKKLRPKYVECFGKFPHNICICQIHENVRCALKALKQSQSSLDQQNVS